MVLLCIVWYVFWYDVGLLIGGEGSEWVLVLLLWVLG